MSENSVVAEPTAPFPWLTLSLTGAALLALKTAVVLTDSTVFGRLAVPPVYDDVSYFIDALHRIDVFRGSGVAGYLRDFHRNWPHAPYSTIAASIAFMVAGPARGAAYAMNAVAILLITLFWLRLFRVSLGI